ncbi:MAG: Vi polysaccharide biosynthesis UDP-N-acetylglucosamine C-6 dehydrogenase TviB, partial [Pseudomonadota bacterium]
HYDAIVVAVAHRQFQEMGVTAIRALGKAEHVLYDIKYALQADEVDGRL